MNLPSSSAHQEHVQLAAWGLYTTKNVRKKCLALLRALEIKAANLSKEGIIIPD
jgi:hypothetical protein